jgi:hypothetical protein
MGGGDRSYGGVAATIPHDGGTIVASAFDEIGDPALCAPDVASGETRRIGLDGEGARLGRAGFAGALARDGRHVIQIDCQPQPDSTWETIETLCRHDHGTGTSTRLPPDLDGCVNRVVGIPADGDAPLFRHGVDAIAHRSRRIATGGMTLVSDWCRIILLSANGEYVVAVAPDTQAPASTTCLSATNRTIGVVETYFRNDGRATREAVIAAVSVSAEGRSAAFAAWDDPGPIPGGGPARAAPACPTL